MDDNSIEMTLDTVGEASTDAEQTQDADDVVATPEADESMHEGSLFNADLPQKKSVRGFKLMAEQQAASFGELCACGSLLLSSLAGPLEADKLYEYIWPPDGKERWFLQEQVRITTLYKMAQFPLIAVDRVPPSVIVQTKVP